MILDRNNSAVKRFVHQLEEQYRPGLMAENKTA